MPSPSKIRTRGCHARAPGHSGQRKETKEAAFVADNTNVYKNLFLKVLPPRERALLEPSLQFVELPQGELLAEPGKRVSDVIFLDGGMARLGLYALKKPVRVGLYALGDVAAPGQMHLGCPQPEPREHVLILVLSRKPSDTANRCFCKRFKKITHLSKRFYTNHAGGRESCAQNPHF